MHLRRKVVDYDCGAHVSVVASVACLPATVAFCALRGLRGIDSECNITRAASNKPSINTRTIKLPPESRSDHRQYCRVKDRLRCGCVIARFRWDCDHVFGDTTRSRVGQATPPAPDKVDERELQPEVQEVHVLESISFNHYTRCR
jgi:hypothetical protein